MLETEMYPIFEMWLRSNSDMYAQELLIPAICCFDFIALQEEHLVAYELKIQNAKDVIYQANMALLWVDHSYAVLTKEKSHLGLKHSRLLSESTGLMSMDMKTGDIEILIEPEIKNSHLTISKLRQDRIQRILMATINNHQDMIASWKQVSHHLRQREDKGVRNDYGHF